MLDVEGGQKTRCRCPCHVSPERDIHVSPLTRAVIWCCHSPFSDPPPTVEPTPMFKIEMIEVKPMEAPSGLLFYMDFQSLKKEE